jgi:hypothetical protein
MSSPGWEEVELPTLEGLSKTSLSLSFKTLKKLRLKDVLALATVPMLGRTWGETLGTMDNWDIDDNDVTERTKIERALQIIMSDWNKLNPNFQMIYLEFNTLGRAKTKYQNTISDILGEIQTSIQRMDAKMQLLGAGLGTTITKTEEGPISIWEAIQLLWTEVKLATAIRDGHHLYLDDLERSLPNWGTTLDNLVKIYQENLPRIGDNLTMLGEKIRMLETKDPAGNLNPFMNLGASLGNGGANGAHCVQQTNFENAKAEIEEAFHEVKEALRQQDSGGSAPTSLTAKVDKALHRYW